MINRIRLLNGAAAIVAGDVVVIGADTYEFRASTPPAGGTAGRIWVYQGANAAASRVNFIDAVNGVVDAARITRDGTNTQLVVASAGVTVGDVIVQSADAIGGNPAASATALVCTETTNLHTATDVWDQGTMYGGNAEVITQFGHVLLPALGAAHIAKGNIQARFPFNPTFAIVRNQTTPRVDWEPFALVGNAVSITLAGGVAPAFQALDVLSVLAFG